MNKTVNTRDYEVMVLHDILTSVKRYKAILNLYIMYRLKGYTIRFTQYGYIEFSKHLDNGTIDIVSYHKTMFN